MDVEGFRLCVEVKFQTFPDACYKCKMSGHFARDCPGVQPPVLPPVEDKSTPQGSKEKPHADKPGTSKELVSKEKTQSLEPKEEAKQAQRYPEKRDGRPSRGRNWSQSLAMQLQMINMYSRHVTALSWNVRGFCSLARQMYVQRLINSDKIDVAMLQETKTGPLQLQIKGVGDAPNKTFFKALRAKDCELITALRRSDGSITEDEAEIKVMLKESLSDIVGKPDTWNDQTKLKLNRFLEPLDDKISEEKKLLLGRPFSVYEVETVVKGMKKEKTPGPDGIQAEVLQEMIEYAGQDLCDLLNHWRKEGSIQPNFNQGLIKLIPKGQDRLEIRNYRPLTMLNSVYKVMAKALVLRIKYVVNQVVHPKQFGFVQGRSIHEAILNVITAIDWAAEQDQDYVMINMDLEKAYDRVSWDFILAVVDRLGFGITF
ncbi:hypothetical protein L7F22_051742 [Adiantum nelumboides]|nr:hypothetical protein [Adiantum nelumboides]